MVLSPHHIPAGREMQPQRKTEEQVLALSVLESISSSTLSVRPPGTLSEVSLILICSIHLTPTALACPVYKGLELVTPGVGPEGLGCEIFGSGALCL